MPDGQITKIIENDWIHLIPGSFNPLHNGHIAIYDSINESNKFFEISLTRIDKPTYSFAEIERIIGQFKFKYPVILRNQPKLAMKLYLPNIPYSSTYLHIGYDTYERWKIMGGRLFDPRPDKPFIVYPRIINGEIKQIDNNEPHARPGVLCRNDYMEMSSSNIRNTL